VVVVTFLDHLVPGWGGEEPEECGVGNHDYGPWEDRRIRTRQRVSGGNVTISLDITLKRTCQECGGVDCQWRPNRARVLLYGEEQTSEYLGSPCDVGLPIFEDYEVDIE